MHDDTVLVRATTRWLVRPTNLPTIRRRCRTCPSTRYRTRGRFRVNANHKLLDVWLLALCARCDTTARLTVLERVPVRSIAPATLHGFHHNDPGLAATLLADPQLARRNAVVLDWAGAWALERGAPDRPAADVLTVDVQFRQPIPIGVRTLLATGLLASRAEVANGIAAGRITSDRRLTGRCAGDFSFAVTTAPGATVGVS
jgi:hypothetical protein